ncbi:MAG: hypothetical protein B7Z06_07550 [Flavobacteriales bacterium 32-35-8]|nr:MAG: hypothetical protein B7Z06_07550 [Flavobacteriales bacterium 32-35-8]
MERSKNEFQKIIMGLLLLFVTTIVKAQTTTYNELYRSQYHFSPQKGWIGDPCGFIHYQDVFHMYWWGHLTSDDLVYYNEENSMAMKEGPENISYFTGSVVIDKKNTAGFGENAYIAIYTIFDKDTKNQSQGISYSLPKLLHPSITSL